MFGKVLITPLNSDLLAFLLIYDFFSLFILIYYLLILVTKFSGLKVFENLVT